MPTQAPQSKPSNAMIMICVYYCRTYYYYYML
jgi:hypothetical protein